jgi:hypothetical protein
MFLPCKSDLVNITLQATAETGRPLDPILLTPGGTAQVQDGHSLVLLGRPYQLD